MAVTETATPAVADKPAAIVAPKKAPLPTLPLVGSVTNVTFYDAEHVMHNVVAHVLSVGAVDPVSNQPELAVAFPDPLASPTVFASANWQRGYIRLTGVKHFTMDAVKAGQESIAWGGGVNAVDGPKIPQPEGDATRPYFTRQDDPAVQRVSIGQAASVQSGQAPLPTTQSPLINEPYQRQPNLPVNPNPIQSRLSPLSSSQTPLPNQPVAVENNINQPLTAPKDYRDSSNPGQPAFAAESPEPHGAPIKSEVVDPSVPHSPPDGK